MLPNGLPAGPIPYTQVLPNGELVPAPAQPPPPPKKDDMSGLY